jgi:hypothetical protein
MTFDYTPLLLADSSVCLRLLVLRDLLWLAEDDAEVQELLELRVSDPIAAGVLGQQQANGSWAESVGQTAMAMMRLGYLGFREDFPAVQRGAEYLFSKQLDDGSWLPPDASGPAEEADDAAAPGEGYAIRPLQTAIPLRGLAACGFATDPRAERAYDWLLAQRLPDGAWPTGIANSGVYGYVAGYRRMAHSRWGCRSNTTGALLCLALHPQRRRSAEARRALDLLLGRETRDEFALGFEVARLVGAERARGFITFYARFDLALLLDLCRRVGANQEDGRVRDLVAFVRSLQGPYGLWEYARRPQITRWLTFDLRRSLEGIFQSNEDWMPLEPRTPFQPYPKKQKRY